MPWIELEVPKGIQRIAFLLKQTGAASWVYDTDVPDVDGFGILVSGAVSFYAHKDLTPHDMYEYKTVAEEVLTKLNDIPDEAEKLVLLNNIIRKKAELELEDGIKDMTDDQFKALMLSS